MPIPNGEITTTEIWNNPDPSKQNEKTEKPEEKPKVWVAKNGKNDGKKKYRVELIVKRRVVVNVEALDEEDACMVAQDVYETGDNEMYDEFILGPDATVEEVKE